MNDYPLHLRPTALVGIEDPAARAAIVAALAGAGWSVIEAANGYELVEQLAGAVLEDVDSIRPDLLIAQTRMRGFHGTSLAAELLALGWQTPVLLIVPPNADVPAATLHYEGVAGLFTMPLDIESLLASAWRQLPRCPGTCCCQSLVA